ncbi:pre-rRNA-processing protein TSR2, partial [Tremellales sp. Uapishka_1]
MSDATTSPTILFFARGLLSLLDLWPALTIAVREQWGGAQSAEKKTWLASTIIDEFESRATFLADGTTVDPATATDPPLDLDDLIELLNQMMSDEFDANIEDGSIDLVAGDIVRLWRDILASEMGADGVVAALERKAEEVRGKGVRATQGGDLVDVESESESGSGDEMEVDEAPQLVERKEREEPEVDDEGFTMVKGKGKGKGKGAR